MVLGGGRDDKEGGGAALRGEGGGREEERMEGSHFRRQQDRAGAGQSCGLHPQGCSWAVPVDGIKEAVVEGICPAYVSIFPKSVPNCPALPLPVPPPPATLPLPPATLSLGKSSQLIKAADCLEMKGEGWRQFGGLIFPSCAIIW